MMNSPITTISQEAILCSRKLVDKETFALADQNLLLKMATIAEPVETDFSHYSTLGYTRMSTSKPASGVCTTMKQLDTFICHLRALKRHKERGYRNYQLQKKRDVQKNSQRFLTWQTIALEVLYAT